MKILIIRFSAIGDIVLTTPILRCLREKYPNAQIDYLMKESYNDILLSNPFVDQIHLFKGDLKDTIRQLRNVSYDFIIDLQKNLRSKRIINVLNVPSFTFPKLNTSKWLLVQLKTTRIMPDISIVDRYFKAVKKLKVVNDQKGLDFFIPEYAITKQEDIPLGHINGFVACVIGGTYFTKRFPVEKWIAFAAVCPFPMILLGGPEELEASKKIEQSHPHKIYNACGKFSLLESVDLLKRSRVVVTNDTGLMHIAAAFQKPIVSLWGNTVPEMGMFPYYGGHNLKQYPSKKSIIIEVKGLPCRPCSKIGFSKCPKGHFKCMLDIDVLKVAEAVKQLWK